MGVESARLRTNLFECTDGLYPAIVQIRHDVTVANGSLSVGDRHGGYGAFQRSKRDRNRLLGLRVQSARGFVQHQEPGVGVKGARYAESLPLTSAEHHTSLADAILQALATHA